MGAAGIVMRRKESLWKSLLFIQDLEKLLIRSITLSAGKMAFIPIIGARKIAGRKPPPMPAKPLIAAAAKATAIK